MGYLVTVLVFALVVTVHELGHMLAMRRNGIDVLEFAFGFGPKLLGWKGKSGTEYCLCLIPFGGYVKTKSAGPGSMEEASAWVKIKVALAGPLMNCVLGSVCLAAMLYMSDGNSVYMNNALVDWMPAAVRPLVIGTVGSFLMSVLTPPLVLWFIVTRLPEFIAGLMGPIEIVQMGGQIGSGQGIIGGAGSVGGQVADPTLAGIIFGILFFAWLLNVGVAGFNLMPMFPLDGGHVVTALIERLQGRRDGAPVVWFRRITMALTFGLIFLILGIGILRMLGLMEFPTI